jgi:hypothetical protein
MNQQIKQLALQAGLEFDDDLVLESEPIYYTTQVDLEKFAQLIVAECCVALHPMLRDMISRTQGVDMIVKHFRGKE